MIISRRHAVLGIASTAVLMPSQVRSQTRATPIVDPGSFYPVRRSSDEDADLTLINGRRGRALGQVIELSGRVLDRRGTPIIGATLEAWQANAAGRYAHVSDENTATPLDPNFQGFGKLRTNRRGEYRITTIKPGAYADGDASPRPPHIHFDVSGSHDRITTQMIFPDDPLNETDDVLASFPRGRLTAVASGTTATGAPRFVWDIFLQSG